MNQDQVKSILLKTADCETDFTVVFSGKQSKRVNGLYKPETHEILLHNKNFADDNALVYTALHEYAHHLHFERGLCKSCRCHSQSFWAIFHDLLEKAERQGFYKIGAEDCPELAELTREIREKYIAGNGKLMVEFGQLLLRAHDLCQEHSIRYEDYVDRVLRIPRNAANIVTRVSSANLNAEIGFENMKSISAVKNPEARKAAETAILSGKSPATMQTALRASQEKSRDVDEKTLLTREKARIEKALSALNNRLDEVNAKLEKMDEN